MPNVPELTAPTVSPAGAPDTIQHIANISPETFGAGIGQSLQTVGDVGAKQAMAWQDLQNEAEAKDLQVKAITQIGQHEADYYSKTGRDAMDGLSGFVSNVQDVRQSTLAQASNPAVARMLDQQLARQTAYTIVGAGRHAGEQTKQYALQSSRSAVELAQSQAAQEPDHDAFQGQLDKINSEVDTQAKTMGWDDTTTKLEKLKQTSGAWNNRLTTIAQTNPLQARDLLNHVRGDLDGVVADKLQQHINQQILTVGSKGVADSIVQGGPTQTVQDRERFMMAQLAPVAGKYGAAALVGGMSAQESGLDPTKVNPGDGSDGSDSIGIAQWNAGRAKALKEFAAQQGKDYHDFPTQVAFVKQELAQRPDLLRKLRAAQSPVEAAAIANQEYEGSADTPIGNDRQRRGFQNRVDAAARLSSGDVPTPGLSPDAGPGQLERAENSARAMALAQAKKYFPDDENLANEYADQSVQRVRQQYGLITQAHNDNVNAATQNVYEGIQNGDFHSLDDLRASPDFQKLPPEKQSSIQQRFSRISDVPRTDQTDQRYAELVGMAAENPKAFMDTDLSKENLPHRDLTALINRRGQVVKQATSPINAVPMVTQLLKTGELSGTSADTDATSRQTLTGMLQIEMERWQQDNDKKPTIEDVRNKIMPSLLRQYSKQSSILGVPLPWSSSERGYEVTVPDRYRQSATEAWHQRYPDLKREPSEAEIRRQYISDLSKKNGG